MIAPCFPLFHSFLRKIVSGPPLLVLLAVGLLAPALSADDDPLHVLFITGGGWHDFTAQRELLTAGIHDRLNVTFTIDHEAGSDPRATPARFADPDWAKNFDLVLYNISLSVDQKPETAQAIIDGHVKHAVPAVFLHGSVHSYRRTGNEQWFAFLGMKSMRHDTRRPFANEVLAPNHPIMRGFPDPWQQEQGELYLIERTFPTATPLAQAFSIETESRHPTVWVNRFRGVLVFATTIGHHNETVGSETYLDLVCRGIRWATDQ